MRRIRKIGILLLLPALLGAAPAVRPVEAEIASGGKPRVSVVVSKDASSRVKQAARTLADYLGRIAGSPFAVTTGDGRTGLAVGTQSDFPALGLTPLSDGKGPTRREDYLLESHPRGVHVLGATD